MPNFPSFDYAGLTPSECAAAARFALRGGGWYWITTIFFKAKQHRSHGRSRDHHRFWGWAVPACLLPVLAGGCASMGYRKPTGACLDDYAQPASTDIARQTREWALRHPAYDFIPFQRTQMHWYDPRYLTWYFLGNDSDGIFGEGMAGEHPYSTNINCLTWFRWDVTRNFGHNMLYYPPLGSASFDTHWNWSLFRADAEGVKALRHDPTEVFGVGRRAFKINLNDLKPFLSLKLGNFETYAGWRERGNLGASLRFHRAKGSVPNIGEKVTEGVSPEY